MDETIKTRLQEKSYELAVIDGHAILANQSTVRLGHYLDRASHTDLRQAVNDHSDYEQKNQEAAVKFLDAMKTSTLFAKETIQIVDIGHGDGQTLRAVAEKILQDHPGKKIQITAIDFTDDSRSKTAEQIAELKAEPGKDSVEIMFVNGKVGHPSFDPAKVTATHGGNFAPDIILGLNVYNMGDLSIKEEQPPLFMKHVEAMGGNDALQLFLHEGKDSATQAYKKDVHHVAHLRPEPVARGTELDAYFKDQPPSAAEYKHAEYRLNAAITIAPFTDQELKVLASIQQADFGRDYSKAFKSETDETVDIIAAKAFQNKKDVMEFILQSPLEAYDKEVLAVLVKGYQEMLVDYLQTEGENAGKSRLYSYSEAQLFTRNPELVQDMQAAAKQCREDKSLDPAKRGKNSEQSRDRAPGA